MNWIGQSISDTPHAVNGLTNQFFRATLCELLGTNCRARIFLWGKIFWNCVVKKSESAQTSKWAKEYNVRAEFSNEGGNDEKVKPMNK